jgi:hypothetical protein
MQGFYDKVLAWLDAITPSDCTIIIANQNAPSPARPFVTVKAATVTDIARDKSPNVRDANAGATGPFPSDDPEFVRDVVRFLRINVDLQVFGEPSELHSAETIAQSILDAAYDSDAALDTLGRSVAFQLVTAAPQSIDAVIGAEFEPRVVMSMQFGATRDIVHTTGGISTVIFGPDPDTVWTDTEGDALQDEEIGSAWAPQNRTNEVSI